MAAKSKKSRFVSVETVYKAQVSWWWTERKLHDNDYHITVNDAVAVAVNEAEVRFDVVNNTCYCCQWEGIEFTGSNLEAVTAAANYVAATLSRFKDIEPLELED